MRILKRIALAILAVIVIFFVALTIYASNPYQPLDEMSEAIEQLDTTTLERYEDFDEIRYRVESPKKQILFMPGGLVKPQSYEYLAIQLALSGYDVTIFKPFFHLAILTPNYAKRFLSQELDNVVIGHSLGGVVSSIISSDNDLVSTVILLGSYPIKTLMDKDVLFITAEFDINMNQEEFDASLDYVNDDAEIFNILGGNHAQFGWYGPQKGDGVAVIDTLTQQDIVVEKILEFIENGE